MLNALPGHTGALVVDQARYNAELLDRATFHPMGYAVEISTNSADVLTAAARMWRRYPPLSDSEPVRLRVISGGPQAGSPRHPLPPRGEEHLLSIVHGPHDFALADLNAGFAFASLSENLISDRFCLAYYFLEPLVYTMLAARHFALIHASCISRNGSAIVLCGESGSGKTCLAYACARRGWGFVSGDAVHVVKGDTNRAVIGRPYEIRFRESAAHLFPELDRSHARLRPNGKTDLELDTADLNIPIALTGFARHIVFIERSNATGLEAFSRDLALAELEKTICYGGDQTRLEQRATLAHFAGLPVWRLYCSDLDQAERALQSLSDEVRLC